MYLQEYSVSVAFGMWSRHTCTYMLIDTQENTHAHKHTNAQSYSVLLAYDE